MAESNKEFELVYFDLHARAEANRMVLAHAKADWNDRRVGGDSWKALKESGVCPNGQIPVLFHKGKVMNESMAILRYLGKVLGYYPEDAFAAW